ncbi:MAG: hypothetical protein IKQ41_12440 [Clostridia bacterium]|nr:hypothetical protein [Clostridia bacterium]
MKKIACLLLTLILLVSCCAAFAEETASGAYEKPILFRGIPWGSTWEEAQKYLPEGIEYSLSAICRMSRVDSYMQFNDKLYNDEQLGRYYYASDSKKLNGMKVAGYALSGLYLYFAGTSDDSGYLAMDETHGALLYAEYRINAHNYDAVFKDLLDKLTSLYGDADVTNDKGTQYLWYGADGTMASLALRGDILIRYGFSGADALIEQAHQVLMNKEVLDAGNSTDGL